MLCLVPVPQITTTPCGFPSVPDARAMTASLQILTTDGSSFSSRIVGRCDSSHFVIQIDHIRKDVYRSV